MRDVKEFHPRRHPTEVGVPDFHRPHLVGLAAKLRAARRPETVLMVTISFGGDPLDNKRFDP